MSEARPRFVQPMKPTLVDEPPAGAGWTHEVKFDGFRTQLIIAGGEARAYTISGIDWTQRYRPIAQAVAALKCRQAIIDGEVYLPDERGAADFHNLASAIGRRPGELVYVAFDLMQLDGEDLRQHPLEGRRARLRELMAAAPARNLAFSEAMDADGPAAFAAVAAMGLEGIVSKRLGSRYKGGDTRDWLKTKTFVISTLDLIGVDRTPKRGAPVGLFADAGRYIGDATIALPTAERDALWRLVEEVGSAAPPMAGLKRGPIWLPPGIRARVKHLIGDGKLRHATFQGFVHEQPDEHATHAHS